ncbi:response regulator transcription factor [Cupriavidus sp. 30B13]|uniref:helix-turn-helix transcriptional regulator n=1 Tax=Cupriavidus sp. 30B13 TaxID=3384241 RepID=UPI003B8F7DC5
MLGSIEGVGEVICVAPAELAMLRGPIGDIALVVLGVPAEAERQQWLLETACTLLSPQYLLLFADAMLPGILPPGLARGSCTWLPRSASLGAIEAVIRLALAGKVRGGAGEPKPERHLSLATLPAQGGADLIGEAQLLQLTPRQYEVLVLLSQGYPIKTVSRMLNISVATVKSHVALIYQRLQVRNKTEAIYAARQRGARLDAERGERRAANG